MLGLNDTVIIKTKTHTSDGRGGVTTALTTKINSLICSIQPVRREEQRFDESGQIIVDPWQLMFENITSGSTVVPGDIVVHGSNQYLVISVMSITGLGTHTEAILRRITGNAHVS